MAFKYRADQVGSFLRPQDVLDARARGASQDELRAIEDRHILDILQRQKELGFKVFTDGEIRRTTFMSDFNEAVDGVESGDAFTRQWSGPAVAALGVATGKVTRKRRMTRHEMDFMKAHSPGDIKMTLPSANQFPAILFKKGLTDKVYSGFSEFLWDIVPIIKAEVAALADDGAAYIQIDAPRYSYYIDPKWRDYVKNEMGMDPDAALDEAIKADNACLEGVTGRPGVVPASTSVAATTAASGTPKVATIPSPRSSSTSSTSTPSRWNTKTSAPAASSRCASSPATRLSSSASSAASSPRSSPPTTSPAASQRPPPGCPWTTSPSNRSAASPR